MRRIAIPLMGTVLVTALAIVSLARGGPEPGVTVLMPASVFASASAKPGCLSANPGKPSSAQVCREGRTASR